MSKRFLPTLSLLALSLVAGSALAANLYKYKNADGRTVIENTIPPDIAAKGGYQIITRSGQVVQDVPVVNEASREAARHKQVDDAQNATRDAELRKLYSAPVDAVRLRDRQIDAIKLKADFVKSQLLQLSSKRKAAVDQAAQLERTGQAVPAGMKANITQLNQQAANLEGQVKQLDADQDKIRADFVPIIQRLNVLYPDKAIAVEQPAQATAAPAATTPAAPAAPAAK